MPKRKPCFTAPQCSTADCPNIQCDAFEEKYDCPASDAGLERIPCRLCHWNTGKMVSPKENVIDILSQTFDRLCADIATTIDTESKYDLKFVFDKNKLPFMWQDLKDKE